MRELLQTLYQKFAKPTIVAGTLAGAIAFGSKEADAQSFSPGGPSGSTEATLAERLDANRVDGYARFGAHADPVGEGMFGEAALGFNSHPLFKPRVYGLTSYRLDNIDNAPDLHTHTHRVLFGNAMDWEFDFDATFSNVYFEPQLGFESNTFNENIDLLAERFIAGGQAGVEWRNSDTPGLLGVGLWAGFGKNYEGKLLSGLPVEGNYEDFTARLNLNQFFELGEATGLDNFHTEWYDNAEIVAGFKEGYMFGLNAYVNHSKFGDLLESSGGGARASLMHFINNRSREEDAYGGWLWQLGGAIQYDGAGTSSGLSERETSMNRFRIGALLGAAYVSDEVGFTVGFEGGYQLMNTNVYDPGQATNEDQNHDGWYVGISVGGGF